MRESAGDMIGQERATRATFYPSRAEHEMIDDQLAASVEEVGERFLAVRPLEDVLLVDLDPGQFAPLGAHPVAHPGKLFLVGQVEFARLEPFFSRYDFVVLHRCLDCFHRFISFFRFYDWVVGRPAISITGRISTAPSFAPGILAAMPIASSRSLASIRK